MTAKLTSIRERLLDTADLAIDFATLGEYGLEPDLRQECERRPAATNAGRSQQTPARRTRARASAVPS